jgi:hypothetical protein
MRQQHGRPAPMLFVVDAHAFAIEIRHWSVDPPL